MMCNSCYVLEELFKASESNPHENYFPTFAFINEMVTQGRLELYAGDCPLEEMKKHLADEHHFTIQHYFKCKSCNTYYLIGACIRGTPLYKVMLNLTDINFDKNLWGRIGTYYDN